MSPPNKRAVNVQALTVDYWRDRLRTLLPDKYSLRGLAAQLAKVDEYYADVIGYSRMQNIVNGRGSLQATARTVDLILRLFPLDAAGKALISTLNQSNS